MKYLIILWMAFVPVFCVAQIAHYNTFPSKQPSHVLDGQLTNISFAYSMRILESNYTGPLIRLRRNSDNAERDFYHGDNDIVDVNSINSWRNGSSVYVVKWYDQSGLGRDAAQPINNMQPVFTSIAAMPYFRGDASNDFLEVPASIQVVTNNGANGTVLAVLAGTKRYQFTFGVAVPGSNRWAAHINWTNNYLYFDPGVCCNTPRNFYNPPTNGAWNQYTLMRKTNSVLARLRGVQKFNGNYTQNDCTLNLNFTLGHANGVGMYSDAGFNEFIMYNTDISATRYMAIENNTIAFWPF